MKRILIILSLMSATALQAQSSMKLTNEECRNLAVTHSETVTTAENELRKSELDAEIAKTNFLPKVEGSAMGIYRAPNTESMGMEMIMHGTYMAGINVQQPIYTGGKLTAAKRLTELAKDCSAENIRKNKMEVMADADNAYWTYVAVLDKIKMLKSYIAYMDELDKNISNYVAADMATDSDRLRVTSKRTETKYQLQKAQTGAELCRLNLCNIIGADFSTMIEPVDTIINAVAPNVLDTDISARPEIALMQRNIDVKEQQVKLAKGDLLPTVGLGVGYSMFGNMKIKTQVSDGAGGYTDYTDNMKSNGAMAMLSVSVPIFNWGEKSKKVKKAQLDVDNARLELQQNSRLLRIQAQQAASNVNDSYTMIQTAEEGLQQAEENLRVMRDKYEVSYATLTDLLDAQAQWQQAKSNVIEAKTQYMIYRSEYLKAVGRLQ